MTVGKSLELKLLASVNAPSGGVVFCAMRATWTFKVSLKWVNTFGAGF